MVRGTAADERRSLFVDHLGCARRAPVVICQCPLPPGAARLAPSLLAQRSTDHAAAPVPPHGPPTGSSLRVVAPELSPGCRRADTAQSAAVAVLACSLSSLAVSGMLSEKRQRNVTTSSRLSQVADVVFRHVYSMAAQGRQAANMAPPGGRYVGSPSLCIPTAGARSSRCSAAGFPHGGGVAATPAASRSSAPAVATYRSGWAWASVLVYQPYILIMQLIGVSTLCLLQPHSSFEPALLAYALPGVAGAVLGLRVFHALTATQFQRMLHLALIVSGSTLLLK